MTQEISYNINKARLEVEKAKRILINLDNLPTESVKIYIEDLISAMNIIGQVILELERGSVAGNAGFEDLNKDVLNKMKIEGNLHNAYFYLKNMSYKRIEKTKDGIKISNWKNSQVITKNQLKKFLLSIEELISNVTRKAMAS